MSIFEGPKKMSNREQPEGYLNALSEGLDTGDYSEADAIAPNVIPPEVNQEQTFGEKLFAAQQGEGNLGDLIEASENSFVEGYRTKPGYATGVADRRSPDGSEKEAA